MSEAFIAYKPLATNANGHEPTPRPLEMFATWSKQYIRLILYTLAFLCILTVIHQLPQIQKHNYNTENIKFTRQISRVDSIKRELPEKEKAVASNIGRLLNQQLNDESQETVVGEFQDTSSRDTNMEYSTRTLTRTKPDDLQCIPVTADGTNSIDGIVWWDVNTRFKYHTVTNYVRAEKMSFLFNTSVTLTTQATLDYMHHSIELSQRWDGPISVAIYAPGADLTAVMTVIKVMRDCLPEDVSRRIKQQITWHLVYDINHGPSLSSIGYPSSYLNNTIIAKGCPAHLRRVSNPMDTVEELSMMLASKYRGQHRLPYPINVLRNTARASARTRYVLASDIELYPSVNITKSFKNLIERIHNGSEPIFNKTRYKRHVFVLPIFEVKKEIVPPRTKSELVKLKNAGDAIFFHQYVCDACQNFPRRLEWIQDNKSNDSEMHIFETTKRNRTRSSWEPIFIGSNDEPFYDDQLTWDGRRDKMAQMYEMCLMDYYLMILDNAFLVHAPGIKHIDPTDTMKRLSFIKQNNAIYESIMLSLRARYVNSTSISSC